MLGGGAGGYRHMIVIALAAVIGIVILQASGAVPLSSVGGPLALGFAFLCAAVVVGLYEAWEKRRGPIGWIVSALVAFAGAFIIAPLGGMIVGMAFSGGSTSLAAGGGPALYMALVCMMLVTIGGAWCALQLVNRWR